MKNEVTSGMMTCNDFGKVWYFVGSFGFNLKIITISEICVKYLSFVSLLVQVEINSIIRGLMSPSQVFILWSFAFYGCRSVHFPFLKSHLILSTRGAEI